MHATTSWRKSSRSTNASECVEVAGGWRKSSRSGSNSPNCVEVGHAQSVVGVRDSKNPTPILTFTPTTWTGFLRTLR